MCLSIFMRVSGGVLALHVRGEYRREYTYIFLFCSGRCIFNYLFYTHMKQHINHLHTQNENKCSNPVCGLKVYTGESNEHTIKMCMHYE